jgi:hypothetical protein
MTRLYRPFAAGLLALALAALGCGGTPTTGGPPPEPDEPAPPKAEVRGDTNLNAAEADFARTQDFTFPVANTGGSPLELRLARKTCSQKGCPGVQVDVPEAPVAPGSQANVVMHWTPAVGSAGAFTFAADVQTNDPKTKVLHFAVGGRVRPLVRVLVDGREDNAALDFGEEPIPPGDKRTREVTVFSTALKSFKLDATCDEPGFKVAPPQPLPPGTMLGDYDNVLSGYTLEVSPTKDLPPGYVRARLNLALSQLGEGQPDRTVPLPVIAVAGQGVCTLSPPGAFLFSKPKVSEEDTAQVRLTYINPPGKEEVTVESVEPSFLQAEKPEKRLGGKWVLTVHLPANNPEAAKYQGDPPLRGKVVLKVAGLEKPLTVPVKWDPLAK